MNKLFLIVILYLLGLTLSFAAPVEEPPDVSEKHTTVLKRKEDVKKMENGYLNLFFEDLNYFQFDLDEPLDENQEKEVSFSVEEQIPAEVMKLHGKKVKIEGFMYPLELDGEVVKSFLLLIDQLGCCFNTIPKANELIYVEMVGEGAEYASFSPVAVYGVLEMGSKVLKHNQQSSLYLIKATKSDPL